jgi:hypothetical protein
MLYYLFYNPKNLHFLSSNNFFFISKIFNIYFFLVKNIMNIINLQNSENIKWNPDLHFFHWQLLLLHFN